MAPIKMPGLKAIPSRKIKFTPRYYVQVERKRNRMSSVRYGPWRAEIMANG